MTLLALRRGLLETRRTFVWATTPAYAPMAVALLVGFALAVVAWGPGRTPALALLLPMLWAMAPSRLVAFVLTAAYHMGVVRFLPEFAGTWFHSLAAGYGLWGAVGLLCGGAWALCWPKNGGSLRVVLSTAAVMLLSVIPPIGAVLPGHPLVGVGFLLPAAGWFGVCAFFLLTVAGCWLVRSWLPQRFADRRWIGGVILIAVAALLWLDGATPDGDGGKVAGRVGALDSRWGGYPKRDSLEVMARIAQVGQASARLEGGEDGIDTLIFAESVLGVYDPSLYPVIELEVLRKTRQAGQTIVVGADLESGGKQLQKIAIVFRPDGSSSYVAARQSVPVSEWAPWARENHFPVDWLANSTVNIGGGITARIMFCYEEYLTGLHLLSELRGDHQLVVAMSNLWASENPLTSSVQASHTEGMARLFGRKWVRAVNLPRPSGNGA